MGGRRDPRVRAGRCGRRDPRVRAGRCGRRV